MPIEARIEKPRTIGDTDVTLAALRKKCWQALTPAVAASAGLTLADADRFMKMSHTPPRDVLHVLAKRLGML